MDISKCHKLDALFQKASLPAHHYLPAFHDGDILPYTEYAPSV